MGNAKTLKENGQPGPAKALEERAVRLAEEIKDLREKNKTTSQGDWICETCGVRCSLDEERQYEAHMTSNLHTALQKIRDKVKELKEKHANVEVTKNGSNDDKDKEKDDKDDKDKSRNDR